MTGKPVRAFRLSLVLEADTKEDLISAMEQMVTELSLSELTKGMWGSPHAGCLYELLVDPNMTHDLYFKNLHEYLAALKKEKTDDVHT